MARVKIGNVYPSDEYLLERCAPAGFGLGHATLLTAKDNLNNIKKNGWYHWKNDSVPANAPTMPYTTYMNVMRVWTNDGGVCCQELMDMSDSVVSGLAIKRIIYGPTAYDWEWVNPPMMLGTEHRTIERYMGKPVYAKLIDCKGMPGTSSKTIAHHDAGVVERIISAHGQAGNGRVFPCKGMDIETSLTDIVIHAENDTMKDSEGYVLLKYTKI